MRSLLQLPAVVAFTDHFYENSAWHNYLGAQTDELMDHASGRIYQPDTFQDFVAAHDPQGLHMQLFNKVLCSVPS